MTARNTIVRAAISRGVAAVSEVDGMTNWGAGPGVGPTAKVNAPRTGWPSTEMTRQYTRYHPWPVLRSGTTSVSGSAAERVGGPAVTLWPAASVTETIAKRGSTASLYVSSTRAGGVLTIPPASGDARSRAACAHAVAGTASAPAAAKTTT